MKRSAKNRLKRFAALMALGLVGSLVFMRFFRGQPLIEGGDAWTAIIVAVFLSTSIILSESLVVPGTRRMMLAPAVLIRTATYGVGTAGSVFFGILLANVVQDGWGAARLRFADLIATGDVFRGSVFALVVVLVIVFVGSISQKLGPGVLWGWLLGRFHSPRAEQCVFMFLDLRDSTTLAEQLGDSRFSALIRDLFSDITPALLDYDARVSHFIGDEVVLYWPIRRGISPDARFAHCFFAICDLLETRALAYSTRYGVTPCFKAGAHWGSVIATEVGEIKSEIVFHGDVLNVASRLEGLCRELGVQFLISGELAQALHSEDGIALADLGEVHLKGKHEPVHVYEPRVVKDRVSRA